MKMLKIFFILGLAFTSSVSFDIYENLQHQLHAEAKALYHYVRHITYTGAVKPYHHSNELKFQSKQHSSINGFSFKNCGDPNKEIAVPSNLSLKPDPVKIPGTLVAAGSLLIKENFTTPLKTELEIYKKVFGTWIKVPCIDGFGSCTYDDLCVKIKDLKCPEELIKIGLHCKCPFNKGNWDIKNVNITIDTSLPVPISGDVKVKADLSYDGIPVTCIELEFTLAD